MLFFFTLLPKSIVPYEILFYILLGRQKKSISGKKERVVCLESTLLISFVTFFLLNIHSLWHNEGREKKKIEKKNHRSVKNFLVMVFKMLFILVCDRGVIIVSPISGLTKSMLWKWGHNAFDLTLISIWN